LGGGAYLNTLWQLQYRKRPVIKNLSSAVHRQIFFIVNVCANE